MKTKEKIIKELEGKRKIKLGAFHIYIVIFAMLFMGIALVTEWLVIGLVGFMILTYYIANGIEYVWKKEINKND